MAFREAIRVALQSLWANKMRSILTLIGVVIAVASVIMVITLVAGANKFVATKVYGYGADVFTASKEPAVVFSDEEWSRYQRRKNLTYEDYQAVAEHCTLCADTGAMASATGSVVYGTHSATDIEIRGWTSEMPSIYDVNIERGRAFTPGEVARHLHIALVGPDIVDNQMGGADPLGKEIRVEGERFTVVGVGERKGKTLGQSQDNWVAVPLTTFLDMEGAQDHSLVIYARAPDVGAPLDAATDQMRVILRSIRHDLPGTEDSFSIDTNQTFVGIWQSISSSFFAVAIALAGIALVVGGIVVMNIMLVSVTERTREIGVRKALGARRSDLMLQFLIESSALALVGGAFGVVAGIVLAKAITLVVGFPSDIKLWSVLLGLGVATSVGIFFGLYPARKAAMLDPIVALRAEL